MSIQRPRLLSGTGNVIFNTRQGYRASMNITGDVNLSLFGFENGDAVYISVIQDSAGGHKLTIMPPNGFVNKESGPGIDTAPSATTDIYIHNVKGVYNIVYIQLNGSGMVSPQQVGMSFDKNNFTDLSDFAINTLGATVSGGKISVPNAGVTDFTKALSLSAYSCINHWKMEIEFQLTQTISASTTGISIGLQGTNADSLNSIAVYFSCSTTNTGRMEFFNQPNGGAFYSVGAAGSNLSFVANDIIRLSIERLNQNVYMRAENLTNPVAMVYYATTMPYNTNPIPPSTGRYTIYGQGGTFLVRKVTVWNKELKYPNIMFVGDSKTMGFGASSFYTTYPGQLGRRFSNVAIGAGFGDKTQELINRLPEILSIKPKQVILSIGSNDARFGISNTTFQNNYSNIVSQLINVGIDVIHLSPSYEPGLDLTAQLNFITANFQKVVNCFYTIRQSGALYSDNIHWSDVGNREVSRLLLDSGLLTGAKTDQEYNP